MNQDKKTVTRVNRYHDGGIKILFVEVPFTRVWTLEAFDEHNNLICSVCEKESNNYIKYVKFIRKVREYGYELTRQQADEIRSEPFFVSSIISLITIDHINEVTEICGYSKDFIKNISNESPEIKNKFAYNIGLYPDELDQVIDRLKSQL
jgi:hypothetical protein